MFRFNNFFKEGVFFFVELNVRLFFYLLFKKCNILVSNDLDTLLPNVLISRLKKKELVYDSHEYFTEVAELVARPKKQALWKRVERYCFPKLKHIFTVSESIAEIYRKEYGKEVKVVRNVPYYSKYIGKKLLNYSDKKIILYQGALNIGRGLEWVIDAMLLVENAVLVIIGDGTISKELKEKVSSMQLNEKVIFLGHIAGSELYKYTPSADLGLCLLENRGLSYYYSLPNRVFDYLHAGVPILATNFPEIANIVNNKTGILINHYEPQYLAKIINDFLEKGFDTSNFDEIAKKLCWKNEEKILKKVYSSFLSPII
jgi:glycosyltransferase involved in cell wall biosynthesis